MSRESRIEALRRLAERPGTEHEGRVALKMLRKMESCIPGFTEEEKEPLFAYQSYMRREMSVDEFVAALSRFCSQRWDCPCGDRVAAGEKCGNWMKHMSIQDRIRERFKKGDRVIYNYHAYPADCPGKVAAYVPIKRENGTYPWGWISVKFDHLKSARQVPIISAEGWHLKHAETECVEP